MSEAVNQWPLQKLGLFLIIAMFLIGGVVLISTGRRYNSLIIENKEYKSHAFTASIRGDYQNTNNPSFDVAIQLNGNYEVPSTEETCITGIDITVNRKARGNVVESLGTYSTVGEALCSSKKNLFTSGDASILTDTFSINLDQDEYFYPYDSNGIEIAVLFYGYTSDHPDVFKQIQTDFDWHLIIPGREIAYSQFEEVVDTPFRIKATAKYYDFEITRPFIYKIITPMLVLVITSVVCILILIQDAGTFIEAILAIVIGIWSARQIILPEPLDNFTIIDFVFAGLYLLLGLALIVWLYERIMTRKRAPYNSTQTIEQATEDRRVFISSTKRSSSKEQFRTGNKASTTQPQIKSKQTRNKQR